MELDKKQLRKQLIQMRLAFDDYQKQSHFIIEKLKKDYPFGTRIKLLKMDDIQAPPAGTFGTINFIDDIGQIHVSWDNGSSLALISGEDTFCKA